MRVKPLVLLAAGLLLVPAVLPAQEKATFQSLDDAFRSGRMLRGRAGPRSVNWIEGGRRFSYTQRGDSGEEIRAVDPATGTDSLLFTANGLQFPDTNEAFSYQSFQWSRDSKFLVFQTRFKRIYRRSGTADYFVYSLAGRKLQLAARGARTAELSPDGTTLGYERGGDLYTYTLAQKKEKRLTLGATDLVHNGRFDWVYEEEFGKAQAWNWSPDSRYIAYWQVDESPEPVVQFSDYQGWHPDWERIRIPSVGDSNARVRIGVVNVTTGRRVWLDPREQGEYYVPRLYWTSRPDTLAMLTLNRPQSVLKLWFFDARNGGRRLVHTWQSDTWIDVYDFYSNVLDMMTFPEGQDEFLWISDQDGWQHIYRYGYDGKLIKQVTRGPWSVTRIEGVDPKAEKIYYTSTEATPLERQLYVIDMDGGNKTQLTTTAGTHEIDMSPDTRYYIDSWSSTRQPRQVELWATGGAMLKKMEDNAAVSQWLESHVYSPAELFSFTTSDSVKLDGSIIKPPAFDSTRRYPVVFDIYGGPGSQQVYNEFATSTWAQWLAQQGYVVIGLNNRGSNNYGAAFEKIVYDHLGRWESHDFAEAARYLAAQPWVDARHIAIMGTSYGGYSTLYTMAAYPGLFSVGVANSAVTDWRFYDTIYTERYMNLLGDNAAGYDSSSVLTRAADIKGKVLLIHSMMDDNVHPVNTMQFLTTMTDLGKDVDLRIYPPGHHGAAYNLQSFRLIQQVSWDFLKQHMQGPAGGVSMAP